MRRLMLAAAAAVMSFGPGAASAEDVWKVASAAQPGSTLLKNVEDFGANATKNSGGKLKVESHFIGSEQEIAQQVVRGRIEIASISFTGISPVVPEASVMNNLYLWKSDEERVFVKNKYILDAYAPIFAEKGLVMISLGEVGWNDVVCKFECLTPDLVKGKKARVSPNAASKALWGALGANGVQMPLSELFPGLQSGTVEMADLPFLYYITTPAAQSTPHYVTTRHLHHPSMIVVNKAKFDSLTPDVQAALRKSPISLEEGIKRSLAEYGPKKDEFLAKGGKYHELTEEQRTKWRELVEPKQQEIVDGIGGRAKEIFEIIKKGKAEFAAMKK